MRKYVLIVMLLLLVGALSAQTNRTPALQDSVRIDPGIKREKPAEIRQLHVNHSLQPVNLQVSGARNSTLFLPDSLIRDTLKYEFTKIKEFAYRRKLTRELYKMFFVNAASGNINVLHTQNSEDRFKDFRGKTIRLISIKVLPPYGTNVYDSVYNEGDISWWKDVVNKTHMGTSENVIRRQLTIKPGIQVIPFELVQNEILLRKLDYIDDVNIRVEESVGYPEYVDIVVVCKDELSWGGSVETNFLNNFKLGINNKNSFKLGHVVDYEFSYRGTKDKKWGNKLEYKANSIWGTHIDIRGFYRNDFYEKQVRIDIERHFLTAQMRWAGGVAAGRVFYSEDLPDMNVSRLDELFNYHFQDVWLGRSFSLPERYSYNQNVYLTGRFFTTHFIHRPLVDGDTNHLYYNRMNVLGSVVFTKLKYYKANLIYDFGRTEDVPAGLFVSATSGFEWSEYDNYVYLATEACYSHFNRHTERYYAFRAALGSYLSVDGFERGMLEVGANHISNLCNLGALRFRFYNDARYIRGFRRYPADHLYMEDTDIRGFSSDTLEGVQKLTVSVAATLFLPYIKKGFRTAISTFVDAGLLAPQGERLFHTQSYWGIGLGVNLRNDNVVIKNICLRFTFYPVIPPDGRGVQVMMSNSPGTKFYDYRVTKPQVIQYE